MTQHQASPTRRSALGRRIKYAFKTVGLPPRLAHPVIGAVRFVARPAEYWQRKAPARSFDAIAQLAQRLGRDGHIQFDAATLPNGAAVIDTCLKLWRARCIDGAHPELPWNKTGKTRKTFLRNCFLPGDFVDYPELADFVLNDRFVDLAIAYLGAIPRLTAAYLWWSPPNDTMLSSQRYHVDQVSPRQLKFFVNLTEIDADNGPLTFLSAPDTAAVVDALGFPSGRLTDDQVYAVVPPTNIVTNVGPAGLVTAVDTCRCLHFGSRICRSHRLVLMVQFTPYFQSVEASGQTPRIDLGRYAGDRIRQKLLN